MLELEDSFEGIDMRSRTARDDGYWAAKGGSSVPPKPGNVMFSSAASISV